MFRFLLNFIVASYFLIISAFTIFISIVGDPNLKYKNNGMGLLVIPMLILPNIIGRIVWKIKGKEQMQYNKWIMDCKSGLLVKITFYIFSGSLIFVFLKATRLL